MRALAALLFSLFLTASALAQSDAPMTIHRFEGTFHLDGLSDEPGWQTIEPLPMLQYEPDPGQPATQQTEIRIAYDQSHIYLSLRAFDTVRNGVRANTLYRDRLSGDDHFEIMFDTFNDNQTAVIFTTTPAGIRREGAISNDANGELSAWLNVNFNTFWDVKTVINDRGWFAEIRIPFSSLRFQDQDGRVVMGFTAQRKIARRSERLIFPYTPPSISWGFLRPSLAQDIVFEGVRSHNPIYVTPYALAGSWRQSYPELGYDYDGYIEQEIGGDLRYGLTNNLNLDLTVNTDFAQVEADDQQINLTRFSLFYPEKRQFFQERAGLFEFRTGGESRLFHSRRIGLTDDGEPVPIYGGARVAGRMGAWDVGLLNMQTSEHSDLPSENFGVVRLRRRVLNDFSYVGGIGTSRTTFGDRYNAAYGLDGLFRLKGDDYLSLIWAQTFDDDIGASLSNGIFNALLERRNRDGFGYRTEGMWIGGNYSPEMGFIQRRNVTMLRNDLLYTWIPGPSSGLLWHTIALKGSAYLENDGLSLETGEIGPEWRWARRSGHSGFIDARLFHDDVPEFRISNDVIVPRGAYTFFRVSSSFSPPMTARRQLSIRAAGGTFYDGWQWTAGLNPTLYVSPHLELNGSYEFNRIIFPERDQRFNAHVFRLRVGTALNTQLSTNAFVQYNSAIDAIFANVRFRYNFREGNDLWVVYNEGLNTDRHRVDPAMPFSASRSVMVKYTYTLGI